MDAPKHTSVTIRGPITPLITALMDDDEGGFIADVFDFLIEHPMPTGLMMTIRSGVDEYEIDLAESSNYVCSGCGNAYQRPADQRAPKPGQRNYCPGCQENKIPERDAARDYRARKNAKK